MLFVQIESGKSVENAEGIAGVEGVDVLFVGSADLKLSLSTGSSSTSYESSLDKVVAAATGHAIHAGILIRDRKDVGTLIKRGFSKIAMDSDMAILRAGFMGIMDEAKGFRG